MKKIFFGLAILAAVAFFSLAGIPPLVGFYAKVFVFNFLFQNYQPF